MAEFYVSFLFGAVVLVVFAWDQFKHPSYAPAKDLARLVEVLSPPDLRHPRVYWRAYAAYAGMLLLIYWVICAYTTVPILKGLGIIRGEAEAAQGPIVPLTLALAMVGLAPGIPVLQELESKIRLLAHRLSGIPARLLGGARRLKSRPFGQKHDRAGMLVPDAQWERIEHYRTAGRPFLEDWRGFTDNLAKIIAYRWWIIEKRLALAELVARLGIERSDAALKIRIERLILNLDVLSGFGRPAVPDAEGREGAEPDAARDEAAGAAEEAAALAWKQFEVDVDELAIDVCGMLMLRLEHDLLRFDAEAEAGREQAKARRKLKELLVGLERDESGIEAALFGPLWRRASWAAVIVAFVWGIVFGPWEAPTPDPNDVHAAASHIQSSADHGFSYAFSAFMIYSLAIFAALGFHGSWLAAGDDCEEGAICRPNMVTSHWTLWIGMAFRVFLLAALVAAVCTIGFSVAWSTARWGLEEAAKGDYWGFFVSRAYTSIFSAMAGPVLALGIIASIDARSAGPDVGGARWRILIVTVAAMIAVTGTGHLLVLEHMHHQGYKDCLQLEGATPDVCAEAMLLGLGGVAQNYSHAIVLAGLRAGVIGAAVLYFCQETLRHWGGDRIPGEQPREVPAQ